jgi:hypothetical protein
MLVIDGFFENGVFVPEKSLAELIPSQMKGRQKAVLNILETDNDEKQERIKAWHEFSKAIKNSDEILEGEPQRIRFRTPEELELL